MKMKSLIKTIIGRATTVLGCCALAFAGLLACLVWGDHQSGGEFYIAFSTLDRDLRIIMAISAAIGVGGVVLGMRLARVKQSPNGGRKADSTK